MGYRVLPVMDLGQAVVGGDFQIERPLAQGGMAGVYVARQLSTGLQRAVKVMHPTLVADPAMRERFSQEARLGGQVPSEHVAHVIAAGVDAALGMPWIAMELLEGEDLASLVQRRGAIPFQELVSIFTQLCHALGAAHSVGIVHRDVKPENVFLANVRSSASTWQVKVLDFGIARLTADAHTMTRGIGTPLWMAPEQTESTTLTPAADVWSLGLLAFYLLTGRPYWRTAWQPTPALTALMREVVMDPLSAASERARELGVALPPGFDAWFASCVVRDPGQRYVDASQAFEALVTLSGSAGAVSGAWLPGTVQSGSGPVPTTLASGGSAGMTDASRSGPVPAMAGSGPVPATAGSALAPPATASAWTPSLQPSIGVPTPSATGRKSAGGGVLLLGLALVGIVVALIAAAVALIWFRSSSGDDVATRPESTESAAASTSAPVTATASPSASEVALAEPAPTQRRSPNSVQKGTTATPVASASSSAPGTGLKPIDRAAVQAKVDALAASATTQCAKDKSLDAGSESYSGRFGFRPDGSRSFFITGAGGARTCVRGVFYPYNVGKYAHPEEWHVEVFDWSVTVR
ncbi:MAG: protein kinase [Polyangiaceae bacterium]